MDTERIPELDELIGVLLATQKGHSLHTMLRMRGISAEVYNDFLIRFGRLGTRELTSIRHAYQSCRRYFKLVDGLERSHWN